MDQTPDEQRAAYGKVIAQAWSDDTYKSKLLADPATTLSEAGIHVPEDVTVKVTEQQAGEMHLMLPPKPAEGEINDEMLQSVAGGFCSCCCGEAWGGSY